MIHLLLTWKWTAAWLLSWAAVVYPTVEGVIR